MPKEGDSTLIFRNMAAINVIRHSNGQAVYPCGTPTAPRTNPKMGDPAYANTIHWNGRTRVTTLIVPRENAVRVDTWTPQSSIRANTVTYQKPPIRTYQETRIPPPPLIPVQDSRFPTQTIKRIY